MIAIERAIESNHLVTVIDNSGLEMIGKIFKSSENEIYLVNDEFVFGLFNAKGKTLKTWNSLTFHRDVK